MSIDVLHSPGDGEMTYYHPHPQTKSPAGMQKKFLCQYGPYSVYAVDGTYVRDKLDQDFTTGGNPGRYKYIPEDEIWVEEYLPEEDKVASAVHEIRECELMKGKHESYDEAHDKANSFERKVRKEYGSRLNKVVILIKLHSIFKNSMKVEIGDKGLNKSQQKKFEKEIKCIHCGAPARIAFVAYEKHGDKDFIFHLHQNEIADGGNFWPHDAVSVAVYFCTKCALATAEMNQG
jgi:hypothetical protein